MTSQLDSGPNYLEPITYFVGDGKGDHFGYIETRVIPKPFPNSDFEIGKYPYPLLCIEVAERIGFNKKGEKPTSYFGTYFRLDNPELYEQAPLATVELGATIYALRKARFDFAITKNRFDDEPRAFEQRKTEIKGGNEKASVINRKIQEWGSGREARRKALQLDCDVNQNIINATVDVFIERILLGGGIGNLATAVEDLRTNSNITENEVLELLDLALQRVSRTQLTVEELRQIWYKKDSDLLFSRDRVAPISQLVLLQHADQLSTDPIVLKTREFSKILFDRYYSYQITFNTEEPYAMMTFVYDYIIAAAYTDDLRTLNEALKWYFNNVLSNPLASNQFMQEFVLFSQIAFNEGLTFGLELLKEFGYEVTDDDDFSLWEPVINAIQSSLDLAERARSEERKAVTTKLVDLNYGLASITSYLENILPGSMAGLLQQSLPETQALFEQVPSTQAINSIQNALMAWRTVVSTHSRNLIFLSPVLENLAPLEFYSNNIAAARNVNPRVIRSQRHWLERLRDPNFATAPSETKTIVTTDNTLHAMFINHAPKTSSELNRILRENDELIKSIILTRKWFVYKDGDPFYVDENGNDELRDYYIESLIFYPSPEFKGGHRVEIQTSINYYDGSKIKFVVFIDQNGNLFYENGAPFYVTINVAAPFKKLLLERLEFITSGKAAISTGKHVLRRESQTAESESARSRGVFAVLTSTEQRPITLKSKQAVAHNNILNKEYGIDKHTETANRRRAGKLGLKGGIAENQWITFQREKGKKPRNHRLYFSRKKG